MRLPASSPELPPRSWPTAPGEGFLGFPSLGAAASRPFGTHWKAIWDGSILGKLNPFADGGMIPGPIGSPMPILAHGGEYVLPTSVVAAIKSGQAPPANAMSGSSVATAGQATSGQTINNYITNVPTTDANAIANAIGWHLRTASSS